ncbi:hypothetical protein, partial [Paraburkholderia atlantica]|uniref:hypothetical protein n=1 Tax=Paraburkholderia atlantica TaxID=2654982 RepID=UPI001C85CB5F
KPSTFVSTSAIESLTSCGIGWSQARFIFRPVRHAMRHLQDVVPTSGVVLMRHASIQRERERHLITPIFHRPIYAPTPI